MLAPDGDTILLLLDGASHSTVLSQGVDGQLSARLAVLQGCAALCSCLSSCSDLRGMAYAAKSITLDWGSTLYAAGQPSDAVYVIQEGSCLVSLPQAASAGRAHPHPRTPRGGGHKCAEQQATAEWSCTSPARPASPMPRGIRMRALLHQGLALLGPGDLAGEACVLGRACHSSSAFVRSAHLVALQVPVGALQEALHPADAQRLAALLTLRETQRLQRLRMGQDAIEAADNAAQCLKVGTSPEFSMATSSSVCTDTAPDGCYNAPQLGATIPSSSGRKSDGQPLLPLGAPGTPRTACISSSVSPEDRTHYDGDVLQQQHPAHGSLTDLMHTGSSASCAAQFGAGALQCGVPGRARSTDAAAHASTAITTGLQRMDRGGELPVAFSSELNRPNRPGGSAAVSDKHCLDAMPPGGTAPAGAEGVSCDLLRKSCQAGCTPRGVPRRPNSVMLCSLLEVDSWQATTEATESVSWALRGLGSSHAAPGTSLLPPPAAALCSSVLHELAAADCSKQAASTGTASMRQNQLQETTLEASSSLPDAVVGGVTPAAPPLVPRLRLHAVLLPAHQPAASDSSAEGLSGAQLLPAPLPSWRGSLSARWRPGGRFQATTM